MYLDFSELDELEKCTECIPIQRITVWPKDSINDSESKISEFVQDCGQWVEMGILDKVSNFLESPNCYKVTVLGNVDEPVVFYLVSKYGART
jgi:hypothetical protein